MTNKNEDIRNYSLYPSCSLQDTLSIINLNSKQMALVVDEKERLIGVVTDGDIRRALLNGASWDTPVSAVMNSKPKTAFDGESNRVLLRRMKDAKVHFLVKVDPSRRVLGLVNFADLALPVRRKNSVVIMAGGRGKRLGDITADCPKPMLKIGNKPILESIIDKLESCGFYNFYISVTYISIYLQKYINNISII